QHGLELAAEDLALDPVLVARARDEVEPLRRRVRNRHDHDVRLRLAEDLGQLVDRAEDRRAEEAAAAQAHVVVDEADDLHAGLLAELAREAAPASSRAYDERAPAVPGRAERRDAAVRRALGEARTADEEEAEHGVDDEDRAREVGAIPRRRHEA